jgi:hypothetical protein
MDGKVIHRVVKQWSSVSHKAQQPLFCIQVLGLYVNCYITIATEVGGGGTELGGEELILGRGNFVVARDMHINNVIVIHKINLVSICHFVHLNLLCA